LMEAALCPDGLIKLVVSLPELAFINSALGAMRDPLYRDEAKWQGIAGLSLEQARSLQDEVRSAYYEILANHE
jgi:hypothetical protein